MLSNEGIISMSTKTWHKFPSFRRTSGKFGNTKWKEFGEREIGVLMAIGWPSLWFISPDLRAIYQWGRQTHPSNMLKLESVFSYQQQWPMTGFFVRCVRDDNDDGCQSWLIWKNHTRAPVVTNKKPCAVFLFLDDQHIMFFCCPIIFPKHYPSVSLR